ncbi:MAG: phosphoglucosamine mutase [Clostridia bacterium]|nr:phosphoglucosamine mutase [Clostridia bacterium]
MGHYFGTDGFRGEAGKVLTAEHAYKIGRYLGYLFSKDRPCRAVIGKDTRRSGYMLEYALVAGLTASGADAYLLHVTTTPSVAYVTKHDNFDVGIMISASHNPFYDNGIKLISAEGEKMNEDMTDEIEAYLDGLRPEPPLMIGEKIGTAHDYAIGRNRYIAYLISLATRSFKSLRIGLDCANGSTWNIARAVFEALGAKVYVIGDDPNGININQNCGSTHIESLKELVLREQLDCGFAFDGDADRCLAIDDKGELVTGDHILYLCGSFMKEKGELYQNTVVSTVMSNIGLYEALKNQDIASEKTAVGDRFVYECMRENGYVIGGEESGHIIFSKYATTGDGLLTALKVVEVMLEKKAPLSRLKSGMRLYPQYLKNVRVIHKKEILASEELKNAIQNEENALGGKGRILVRASGTEPLIRVMAEAETDALCHEVVDKIAALVTALEASF